MEDSKWRQELAEHQVPRPSQFDESAAPVSFNGSQYAPEAMWRASFPPRENILRASQSLSTRTGLNIATLMPIIDSITSRGQLATITPNRLATEWAKKLNLSEDEIFRYLKEANYILL